MVKSFRLAYKGPVSTCYGVTLENDGDFERVVNINLQLTLVSDTVTITDAYLPVTLINFIGQLTHNNALLNWQTATEINTAYFNIQRSVDGVQFNTVGKVTAAGNSTSTQDYQFTDALAGLNPVPTQLFYRLQVAYEDGAISYSKIIVLDNNAVNAPVTLIYPNPLHNTLNVRLNGITGKVSITIVNAEGKLLQNQRISGVANGEAVTINTSTLAAGIYISHVQYDGKSVVQKFVKY